MKKNNFNDKTTKILLIGALLFFYFSYYLFSQNQHRAVDSLLILLKKVKEDTNKVVALNGLARTFELTGDFENGLNYSNQAMQLAEKLNYKSGIARAYNNFGNINFRQGNYQLALKNHNTALKIKEELKDKKGIAYSYYIIGKIKLYQGNYPDALKNQLLALKLREELGNKEEIASSYTWIGNIYEGLINYPEAINYHLKSLKISEEIGDKQGVVYSYANIGNINYHQGNKEDALKNYLTGIKIQEKLDDKLTLSNLYNGIGNIYSDNASLQNNQDSIKSYYNNALKYFLSSLKIVETLGHSDMIIINYLAIGKVNLGLKIIPEARKYISKAQQMSNDAGNKDRLKTAYQYMAFLDSTQGNYKQAYEDYKMFVLYKDSLINEGNTKKIVQEQMNYEFDKKESLAKAEQDKKDAITAAEKQRQKVITYSVSTGLFLVLLLALFIFKGYRQKQKANVIITQQKIEVEKAKHIIEEKNNDLTDSITYAKRLQKAILPRRSEIHENLPESFILYKPKDIVAGDFYWAEKINSYYYIAAADCTGHGVPGAMVSMVCCNALNRTVNEFGITETGEILDNVRELILDAFKKSGEEIKDGMDISLLSINFSKVLNFGKVEMQWSGANNPLWYFSDEELQEIKADKQSIGKYDCTQAFTTHNLEVKSGTNLYLFTDGYADQFNPADQKMTKKKFKDLVISAQNKSMSEQKQILNDYFENWKGNMEQVDDVCVIGIRI